MSCPLKPAAQIPLFIIVNESEKILINNSNVEWFDILHNFNDLEYDEVAAMYYDALYDYNKQHNESKKNKNKQNETKQEASERLLKNRPTQDKSQPVLFEPDFIEPLKKNTLPESISPGIVPYRLAGKKPKCFYALFKSFIGVALMGYPATPDEVFKNLNSNPAFARVCGFDPTITNHYRFKAIPSERKIQQFDLIMERYGIWSKIKYKEIAENLISEVIPMEDKIVGDTTHYHAYAQFIVVESKDENGKVIKKSQSKVTKNCRCENRDDCEHEYVLADDGAGTVVKSRHKGHGKK